MFLHDSSPKTFNMDEENSDYHRLVQQLIELSSQYRQVVYFKNPIILPFWVSFVMKYIPQAWILPHICPIDATTASLIWERCWLYPGIHVCSSNIFTPHFMLFNLGCIRNLAGLCRPSATSEYFTDQSLWFQSLLRHTEACPGNVIFRSVRITQFHGPNSKFRYKPQRSADIYKTYNLPAHWVRVWRLFGHTSFSVIL